MPKVTLVLHNGGRFVMKTKVVPRIGDDVRVEGKSWGTVERVTCVYDRGEGDEYVAYLQKDVR